MTEMKFTAQACNERYKKCKKCQTNKKLHRSFEYYMDHDLTHCHHCHKKIKKSDESIPSASGVGYSHAECDDKYLFESGHTKALSRNWESK